MNAFGESSQCVKVRLQCQTSRIIGCKILHCDSIKKSLDGVRFIRNNLINKNIHPVIILFMLAVEAVIPFAILYVLSFISHVVNLQGAYHVL